MPKSTRTRFLGIRDNHNHYTSLRLLFYRPIDVDLSKACYIGVFLTYMWETFTLSVIYDPHACYIAILKKVSVGMYSGCDYLLSLKILFVYFLALPSLLHPSILFNYFYTCFCSFFYCMSATIYIYSKYRWEVPKFA